MCVISSKESCSFAAFSLPYLKKGEEVSEESLNERIMRRKIQDNIDLLSRIQALESQVTELVTLLDTLTEKLIEAGVLVKRERK